MKRTALVVGSTGATGTKLTEQLISDERYKCIHVLHYRETPFDTSSKVIFHHFDLDHILDFRLEGIDDVFCCIGTTMKKAKSRERFEHVDKELVVRLAKWAKIDDVQTFHVISAQGANKSSLFFYNRVKGEMEEELIKINLNSLYIYHPPLLKAKRSEIRLAEGMATLISRILHPVMLGPLERFRALDVRKLAAIMIENAVKNSKGVHIISAKRLLQ